MAHTVDSLIAAYPQPIRLTNGPDVSRLGIFAVLNLVLGVPLAIAGTIPLVVVLLFVVLLAGAAYVCIWAFPSYFLLSPEGLSAVTWRFRQTRPWTEVSDFTADDKLKGRWALVAYNDTAGTNGLLRLVAKPAKRNALLGIKRGITPTDLARLLNGYRAKALAAGPVPAETG